MSKVLIIVTSASAGFIYNDFKKNSRSENNEVLKAEINGNQIFVINKDKTSNCEELVKKIISSSPSSDIFICSHTGYIGKDKLSQEVIEFRHNDDIGQELLKFAKKEISFDDIWGYLEKKRINYLTANLLYIFLPLDIDMQALSIIHKEVEEKKREEKDVIGYLMNSKEPEGMLRGQSGYRDKLKDALNRVKEVEALKNKEDILYHLEARKDFLEILDEMKDKVKKESTDDKVKETINEYLNADFWKSVTSFHDWYCALAECLRGEEACKGE
ncbi:MAG: hypothetical protein AB1480_14650 [Nitrospirota bacterium]